MLKELKHDGKFLKVKNKYSVFYKWNVSLKKLDGLGPVDNRPSTD